MLKFKAYPFFLLLVFLACNKDSLFSTEYEASFNSWQNAKKNQGNSYTYVTERSSVFGFGSKTTLTVQDGKVVARAYEAYRLNETTREREITNAWSENKDDLNSHEEGAETITIDEIYALCQNTVLRVSEEDNYVHFLAENNGILSLCSYFPKNCADDCSVGYNIVSINWLN